MKDFFNYLRMPVTINTRLSILMGFVAVALSLPFQSHELLAVAMFLFVVSGDSKDETQ